MEIAGAEVSPTAPASPAFGQADLRNCEREQIHLAGSIQPHAALLVVREPQLVVLQESANAAAFLGLAFSLSGRALGELLPSLVEQLTPHLDEPLDVLPLALRCSLGPVGRPCDVLVHRLASGGLIVEFEQTGPAVEISATLERSVQGIVVSATIKAVCDEAARIFRQLTGYDRVMVYRFDEDGHGEVYSEEREPGLAPLLGNHYPASDIPQIARRLYERNRVRVLVDVEYQPVAVVPRCSPIDDQELDMSRCMGRSMSPIHIQYLKNMGVRATLVVSLVVGGRLWGLVACHHYQPRLTQFELRAGCEVLAEVVGTRIAALESFNQSQVELAVRRLEQRMIEAISRDGDWRGALFDSSQSILSPVGAVGAALLLEDQVLTTGEVPGTQELRELGRWLDGKGLQAKGGGLFATASLSRDEPAFLSLAGVASGLLVASVSNQPGDYLLWFRPEQVRTVTWGGNPNKAMVIGDSPLDLSPRRSFAQWQQVVEKTSEPWTAAALTTARLIGDTLTDVVIQFRAVRMLIAQHQLELVSRQVQRSDQAVLVADVEGRVLMLSQACQALMPAHLLPLTTLADLPGCCRRPLEVGERLRDLLLRRQTWRGEAELVGADGEYRPVLVRADPVYSAPERVLGFVLVFADLSERKAADAARRRFQDSIVEGSRLNPGRLDAKANLLYQNLLSSIVDNAHLAAMEITDGVELGRMPELLDSVRSSLDRSTKLLQHILRHASSITRRSSS